MNDPLYIREADDNDRAFIVDGLEKLQNHEVSLHDTRKQASAPLCEIYFENISIRAHKDRGSILVSYKNNIPIGFICFWIENSSSILETADSNRFGYISDIYVVHEHRGEGVAKLMLEEAKSRLMEDKSIKRLRICSLALNALAVSAYESAGFQPYEITYEKTLR